MVNVSASIKRALLNEQQWSLSKALGIVQVLAADSGGKADLRDIPGERVISVASAGNVCAIVHTHLPLLVIKKSFWLQRRSEKLEEIIEEIVFDDYEENELNCDSETFLSVAGWIPRDLDPEGGFSVHDLWYVMI